MVTMWLCLLSEIYAVVVQTDSIVKKRLMSAYNLDKVAAIQWGVNHEPTAIDLYKRLGAEVKETGNMHIMFIENILLF